MKTDIEIAQSANIKPIVEVAKQLNIKDDDLELYGKYKAKLSLTLINEEKIKKSKLILVTAITPTPAGEGKTTVFRSCFWNEGWCCWWWSFASYSNGRHQSALYRRYFGSRKSQ